MCQTIGIGMESVIDEAIVVKKEENANANKVDVNVTHVKIVEN